MTIKEDLLKVIANDISRCEKCKLHETRTNTVPGEGAANTNLVFIGEAPGADEDNSGRPFVGRAGKLLDKMIERMGLVRNNVHILNVCKCRPPENRKPEPDEVDACLPYLKMQIHTINPRVIVTLGASATEALLGPGEGITKRRGNWEVYRMCNDSHSIIAMPTLHPSYLLRNRAAMADVAKDLSAVLEKLRDYE